MALSRSRILQRSLRWLPGLALAGPTSKRTAADLIERRAARQPDAVFVRFEGREKSYAEYNAAANRIAHWALEKGLGKGSVVALLMENRPEYLEVWSGLAKLGVTTALLNTNLTGKALAHVLEAADCRVLVLGEECVSAWAGLGELRPMSLAVYVARDPGGEPVPLPPGSKSFDEEVSCYSAANPLRSVRAELRGADPLFYIYTSGTTGLPKAARFSHARFMGGGLYSLLSGFTRRDTMYCALPLYHTVGGVMCVNAVLRAGGTLALRRRFSARAFFRDVVEMEATAFQYIGEICRYLLDQPRSELERQHKLRFCVGNGLRPDIWAEFQQRFRIPHITEFYGATESNVAIVNLEGRVGSIGRPAPGSTVSLIRYDVTADQPLRDADGLCMACGEGEVGELLGKISAGRTAAGRFEGYTSERATAKKILADVFVPGDRWFRTGDLLRRDADGFYHFVDRVGDTFRWKGENVSTQEVAEAVTGFADVSLCAVYGVEVPGADGRAGMASVVLREGAKLSGAALHAHLVHSLPSYARPLFLRVQDAPDMTGTFKLQKARLKREGFDPERVSDPLYFRDDERGAYLPLTDDLYARLLAGELRL